MRSQKKVKHWKQQAVKEGIDLSRSIARVYWTLLKIMLPALVIVKVLDDIGGTQWLAVMLSPVMALVGLPESMGIVWATAMLANIYTAMAVFFSQVNQDPLTVAQVTVLGSMILLAHGLTVEAAVAKAAGISWWFTLSLRIGGALLLGYLLHFTYEEMSVLQQPSQLVWQPEDVDSDWLTWGKAQLKTLVFIFIVISALILILRLLNILGIEKWIHWLLTPLLKFLGIGKEAANVTVIGVTLGLSFGGGLLIDEARSGRISKRDIFLSMAFLGLAHSLIEDTLLIVLLGADLSGILWARMVFACVVIALMARVPKSLFSRLSGQKV